MSQINSNVKDDFQVVLLLSCFVEHPVLCDLKDDKLAAKCFCMVTRWRDCT